MSILKEIKYAINSSVGKPYFQSLSKMLKPLNINFLVSSQTISYFPNSPILYSFGKGNIKTKLKSFGSGEIAICVYSPYPLIPNQYKQMYVGLSINKNGELIYQQDYTAATGNLTYRLSVSYGDEIEIEAFDVRDFLQIRATQNIKYEHFVEE